MQIYFSPIPTEFEDVNNFEFEGKQYYYCMEVNEDEFKIADNCGRYVPFDRDSLVGLYRALIVVDAKYTGLRNVTNNMNVASVNYEEAFVSINDEENEISV